MLRYTTLVSLAILIEGLPVINEKNCHCGFQVDPFPVPLVSPQDFVGALMIQQVTSCSNQNGNFLQLTVDMDESYVLNSVEFTSVGESHPIQYSVSQLQDRDFNACVDVSSQPAGCTVLSMKVSVTHTSGTVMVAWGIDPEVPGNEAAGNPVFPYKLHCNPPDQSVMLYTTIIASLLAAAFFFSSSQKSTPQKTPKEASDEQQQKPPRKSKDPTVLKKETSPSSDAPTTDSNVQEAKTREQQDGAIVQEEESTETQQEERPQETDGNVKPHESKSDANPQDHVDDFVMVDHERKHEPE